MNQHPSMIQSPGSSVSAVCHKAHSVNHESDLAPASESILPSPIPAISFFSLKSALIRQVLLDGEEMWASHAVQVVNVQSGASFGMRFGFGASLTVDLHQVRSHFLQDQSAVPDPDILLVKPL